MTMGDAMKEAFRWNLKLSDVLADEGTRRDYLVVDMRNRVGERIWELRERAGLTQGQLAALAGTSQPGIARIERGNANPTLSTLVRIADALDEELGALFIEPKKRARVRARFRRRPGGKVGRPQGMEPLELSEVVPLTTARPSYGPVRVRLEPEPEDEMEMEATTAVGRGQMLNQVAYLIAAEHPGVGGHGEGA